MLLVSLSLGAAAAIAVAQMPRPAFSDDERKAIVTFWGTPGRYTATAPPEAATDGPWRVRLTPDGSKWFLAYQRAIKGQEKIAPTADAKGTTPDTAAWEAWVTAKVAADRRDAAEAAARANAVALKRPAVEPAAELAADTTAPDPGPIPPGLLAAAGNPPPFAAAVAPKQYAVTFPDGESYTYEDHVSMRQRFAYYRFAQGTVSYGHGLSALPEDQLSAIFSRGMTPSEARVARAISKFEGDFEAVNTYDTGFVSVGFIQFTTGEDGKGSLSEVLASEKKDAAAEYEADFRRYGLDVTDDGTLVTVDPSTGAELTGAPAVMEVIEDKRLIAVFQRAGRHSIAFRAAQVQVARSHYWAGDDPLTVTIGDKPLTGKVSDVIHSEAGLATLFDRKVNTGNIRALPDAVAQVMAAHKLQTLADAAPYERDIIALLKYRGDFLSDPTLSQPPPRPRQLLPDSYGSIQEKALGTMQDFALLGILHG